MKITHVLESQQFSRKTLEALFFNADEFKEKDKNLNSAITTMNTLKGIVVNTIFFEPSTRTNNSFQAAAIKLGAQVVDTKDPKTFSSQVKGESLEDTILTQAQYYDVIVMRHPEQGMVHRAAKVSPVPIINAGDGTGQHPTQALLDIYTINEYLHGIDGIKIAMVGDLINGRTIHSLAYMLSKFDNVKIYFVSPKELKIKQGIKDHLTEHGLDFVEAGAPELTDILSEIDVVYMTRVQKERFSDYREYEKVKDSFILTPEIMPHSHRPYIMHPLPRVNEISTDMDSDPRAIYFAQVKNGMYVRMALLTMVCAKRLYNQ